MILERLRRKSAVAVVGTLVALIDSAHAKNTFYLAEAIQLAALYEKDCNPPQSERVELEKFVSKARKEVSDSDFKRNDMEYNGRLSQTIENSLQSYRASRNPCQAVRERLVIEGALN
jgi:hypothetical protein